MSVDHNLAVALRLAAAGIAVFPVAARGPKRPLVYDWDTNSTTDATTIRAWWRTRRGALAAIDLRKAGLVVIDADRHGGPDGAAAWQGLMHDHEADISACPHVRTPNDGMHVYFIQPAGEPLRCRSGRLPPAVECKGEGGSITAPGNVKGDGTFYNPIGPELADAYPAKAIPRVPDWLVGIIRAPRAASEPVQRVNSPPVGLVASRLERYARAALAGQAADVAATSEGSRNQRLNAAAYRLGRFAARGWIERGEVEAVLRSAAQQCGLTADDGVAAVDATIASGLIAGLANPAHEPRSRR